MSRPPTLGTRGQLAAESSERAVNFVCPRDAPRGLEAMVQLLVSKVGLVVGGRRPIVEEAAVVVQAPRGPSSTA